MNPRYNIYALLADSILIIHFAFVIFIVFGLVFIWVGYYLRFRFVQNAIFRICHLASMGIVVCESLIGKVCPLTEWENDLRLMGGQGHFYETTFVKDWVHKIMFFNLSERTFLIIYIFFFLLMLLTLWMIPPKLD